MIMIMIVSAILSSSQSLDSFGFLRDLSESKEERFRAYFQANRDPDLVADEIDVRRYDIDLDVFPEEEMISGSVGLKAAFVAPAESISLNMNSQWLEVDSISGPVDEYTHTSDRLHIRFDRRFEIDENVRIQIFYHGSPRTSHSNSLYFDWGTHGGYPMITIISEPYGARCWWPCKDRPDDKADTVHFSITVPDPLFAASNGKLVSVQQPAGGRARYTWHEDYPIATYLVSMEIANYVTLSDTFITDEGDTLPIYYYIFPDDINDLDMLLNTIPTLELFSRLFGPYPFMNEKYAINAHGPAGAIENQTCTSLHPAYMSGDIGFDVLIHELAHQWWGDMVTCDSFHHVWLNEGFAVYSNALWYEATEGFESYQQYMLDQRYWGSGTVYVEDLSNWPMIFHLGLIYKKASFVLHMLRHVVGDETFFMGLRNYRQRCGYSSATTEDLRDAMGEVCENDLDWFFEQWIYDEYYPWYYYGWSCDSDNETGWETTLVIEQRQLQLADLFKMPVDVRLEFEDGDSETRVVWSETSSDTFSIHSERRVVDVSLDPEGWILCSKHEISLSSRDLVIPEPAYVWSPIPNPTRDIITFPTNYWPEGSISLFDLSGRRLMNLGLDPGNEFQSISLRNKGIGPGSYVVRFDTPKHSYNRILIIVD